MESHKRYHWGGGNTCLYQFLSVDLCFSSNHKFASIADYCTSFDSCYKEMHDILFMCQCRICSTSFKLVFSYLMSACGELLVAEFNLKDNIIIPKNQDSIIEAWNSSCAPDRKRVKQKTPKDLNDKVFEFFVSSKNIPVSGPLLQDNACTFK